MEAGWFEVDIQGPEGAWAVVTWPRQEAAQFLRKLPVKRFLLIQDADLAAEDFRRVGATVRIMSCSLTSRTRVIDPDEEAVETESADTETAPAETATSDSQKATVATTDGN